MLHSFMWLSADKAKIDFLKSEYRKFLADTKVEILANHFRNYRTYKPIELEVSLQKHQLSHLWPDYKAFKLGMDEPTKATAEYLRLKTQYFKEQFDDILNDKFEVLKRFNQQQFEKYFPEPVQGWHVIGKQISQEEEKDNRVMSLLLLDRNKYES
jgi:hypothetical protein